MGVLSELAPQRVFYYFEQICAIPHGSGNMETISRYCERTAKNMGLSVIRDAVNNVIIKKQAYPGYENHPTVILQGHMDMVCEKEADCPIDFEKDGLELTVDGDWISAKGTTLGGDDGIAIAMALALLEDKTVPHPPIEAVFTVNEETGMDGAEGLDPSLLSGKILLNADSECEGVLTVSCAGGARARIALPLTREENTLPCKKIILSGLQGGHSGVEIDKGRINADILLGKLLKALPGDCRIAELSGGTKDNAIPASASCTVATREDLSAIAEEFAKANRPETDPGLQIRITDAPAVPLTFDGPSSARIADFLGAVPDGIQAMNKHIEGLVETSLNLGQLKTAGETLSATFLVRSSVNGEKQKVLEQLKQIAARFEGTFETDSFYPAWEYKEDSRLRPLMTEVYEDLYGKRPVVEAIHAGLECGFFCDKIPGLDAVSFGPDILDIHTPRERLSVSSVARTYGYLCAILKEL